MLSSARPDTVAKGVLQQRGENKVLGVAMAQGDFWLMENNERATSREWLWTEWAFPYYQPNIKNNFEVYLSQVLFYKGQLSLAVSSFNSTQYF